jgi:hypothetical protein
MGFFFRKSIGFGPLRLNLSKAPSPSPGPSRTDSTRPPVALGPPADSIDVYFCFEPLDLRSLARRSAVLFFAAASDAFLARPERSSGECVPESLRSWFQWYISWGTVTRMEIFCRWAIDSVGGTM